MIIILSVFFFPGQCNNTMVHFNNASENLMNLITEVAMQKRLPCIIYIGTVCFIGVLGNIHVIVAFSKPDIKPSTYTVFVKVLAVIDFTTCCIQMPLEIYDLTNAYTFYSEVGCTLFRFFNQVFTFSSDLTLLLIAFERYRRVCKPLKRQMSIYTSKLLCVLGIILSVIIAIPMYIIGVSNKFILNKMA